jgi:hypothetical protein
LEVTLWPFVLLPGALPMLLPPLLADRRLLLLLPPPPPPLLLLPPPPVLRCGVGAITPEKMGHGGLAVAP